MHYLANIFVAPPKCHALLYDVTHCYNYDVTHCHMMSHTAI